MIQRPIAVLEPAVYDPTDTVMVQGTNAEPLFIGRSPGGTDLLCAGCRRTFLAVNILDGQVRDLVARCVKCGFHSRFPGTLPGTPVDFANAVVFLPGGGTLQEASRLPGPNFPVVGLRTAAQFERESGSRLVWRVIRPGTNSAPATFEKASSLSELPTPLDRFRLEPTPASLRELVRRTRDLIGGTTLGELLGAAQASGPERALHPLARQILAVEAAAQSIERGTPTFEIVGVIGAVRSLELLERWRDHPGFPHLVHNVVDPNEYRHAVAVLAVASGFIDHMRNGVALGVPSPKAGRTPDLLCAPGGPAHPLRFEVKSPALIDNPGRRLSRTELRRMIRRKLADAGTGKGGQLGPEAPGFLALVGYEMGSENLEAIEDVASHLLSKEDGRHRHVAGILSFSLDVKRAEAAPGGADAWTWGVEHRTSMNWHYDGPVTIMGQDRPEVLLPRRSGPEPEPPPWPELPSPLEQPHPRRSESVE